MVVITLEGCPISLRGDLTKWLQEISLGVYVGNISARVRDRLWERICEESKSGRATMVFSARNEQHYDFRVHNTTWEPIDFDGIKLMMRPTPTRAKKPRASHPNFSNAAKRRIPHPRNTLDSEPREYVVIDLETTGLDPKTDEIIELGGIRIVNGEEREEFSCVIKPTIDVPQQILTLTGLASEELANGQSAEQALESFVDFVGYSPIVAHNADFDLGFLQNALLRFDMGEIDNDIIDTLKLARTKCPQLDSHRLESLTKHFGIGSKELHRALVDARATRHLFLKLIEI